MKTKCNTEAGVRWERAPVRVQVTGGRCPRRGDGSYVRPFLGLLFIWLLYLQQTSCWPVAVNTTINPPLSPVCQIVSVTV